MSAFRRSGAIVSVLVVAMCAALSMAPAGASSTRSKGARRVARAATEFAKQGSARLSGSVSIEVTGGSEAGKKIDLPFSGSVDNKTKAGTFAFDASSLGLPGGSGSFNEILAGGAVYVSVSSFGSKIVDALGGKHWVKVDAGQIGGLGSQSQQTDPTSTLDGLRGVSNDVQTVGHEKVRGVDTTHYRAAIDVQKALANVPPAERARVRNAFSTLGTGTIPMDVWIDRDGLPRRYALTIDFTKNGESAHLAESFEYFDFGVAVNVHAPPAEDTAPYSELLQIERQSQTT
jgi:hypothetical protein